MTLRDWSVNWQCHCQIVSRLEHVSLTVLVPYLAIFYVIRTTEYYFKKLKMILTDWLGINQCSWSVLACVFLTFCYVGSLYVWRTTLSRSIIIFLSHLFLINNILTILIFYFVQRSSNYNKKKILQRIRYNVNNSVFHSIFFYWRHIKEGWLVYAVRTAMVWSYTSDNCATILDGNIIFGTINHAVFIRNMEDLCR